MKIYLLCYIVIIIISKTFGENYCELGQMKHNNQTNLVYETFEETSYRVTKTRNGHQWAVFNPGNDLVVKDSKSNCCLNITNTETKENVTGCTESEWSPNNRSYIQLKRSEGGNKHINLKVRNGIGKMLSITGSNVQVYLQIVKKSIEKEIEVEDVRNVTDDNGRDKVQLTLPIKNSMKGCLDFSERFNITRDPIICKYKSKRSKKCFEYPIGVKSVIRNNTSWSLNFPSDFIELYDCNCKFWSPKNESVRLSYVIYGSSKDFSCDIYPGDDEERTQIDKIITITITAISVLIVCCCCCCYIYDKQRRQGQKIQQEADFEYDVFFLVNESNHDILHELDEKLTDGSLGEMFNTACADRDFEIGQRHYHNLMTFITKSKNIIIILSDDFLRSKEDLENLKEAIIYQISSPAKLISILVGKEIKNNFLNGFNDDPVLKNYLKSKNCLGTNEIFELFMHKTNNAYQGATDIIIGIGR